MPTIQMAHEEIIKEHIRHHFIPNVTHAHVQAAIIFIDD